MNLSHKDTKPQRLQKCSRRSLACVVVCFLLISCGEEIPLSQFPINEQPPVIGDTVYILQNPLWTGFNEPVDIYVGNEPVLYIADKGNNRIVQMDLSGAVISYSNFILHPKKIAQDRNYDLLVIANKLDTIPPNILDTVDAVYRFKLRENGGVIAGVVPRMVFKSSQPTPLPGDHGKLTGVATYYDNYYLVTRSGPHNSSLIDPDNAIFKIDKFDNTVPVPERLPGFEVEGQGLMSLMQISSAATFPNNNRDLIYTQIFPEAVFKVQWVVWDDVNGTYIPKFTPEQMVDLLRNGLFTQPEDVTVDNLGNIYVVDAGKDSLYKFNSLGAKKSESFGGPTQFSSPMGVAFYYKTLYIADSGNDRVLRFILSTDIR